MSEKTCSQCKHWERDSPTEGKCTRMSSWDSKPDDEDSLATAYDSDDYHAFVVTNAHFGCVMFES